MIKLFKSAGAALALALACSAVQAESQIYLGGGLSSGSATTDFTRRNSAGAVTLRSDLSGSSSAVGFKLGMVLNDGNRVEVGYSSIDADWDGGGKDSFSGFDLDYLIAFGGKLNPYLGVGFGSYALDNSGQYLVGGSDLRGLALNLSGGLLFEVAPNVELEAALKYKLINWQDIRNTAGSTLEMESGVTTVYLGANLKF